MIARLAEVVSASPAVQGALLGGGAAALATALGAVPVLFSHRISQRTQDALLGFGAGVMLAACAFSLILPGLEAAQNLEVTQRNAWAGGGIVAAAVLLGAAALMLAERALPHDHSIKGPEVRDAQTVRRAWLFVLAITLHNVPEGLAIGVGFAGSEGVKANALATGIAIQDIPEGLVVAVALLGAGYRPTVAVGLAALSGLVEIAGAMLGAAMLQHSTALLPGGLGFAAGAMLFVISHEIIPESHRKGHESVATSGLMLGFVLMLLLDTALE